MPVSALWHWQFSRPAEAIWPIVADTARFNEAAEIPKHEIEEIAQPDGSVRYFGRARVGILHYRWEEKPVNWVHGQWFEHCRYMQGSPFVSVCATLRLHETPNGCTADYLLAFEPRNWIGRLVLAAGLISRIGRKFDALMADANHYVRGERETAFASPPPKLPRGASERIVGLIAAIEASGHGHELAARLAHQIQSGQEVDLWSIRPLRLARDWQVPQRHAIEVCLEAVRQGLLRLRWDLLCPRCQVGKAPARSMDELPLGAHCDTCNIDYERDYSNNLELAFYPAAAIRPLTGGEYCMFGPMSTPHVKAQLTLEPGEERREALSLSPGRYRFRTLEPGPELTLDWDEPGFPTVTATDDQMLADAPATIGELWIRNHATRRLTLIVEEFGWMRDALTAKRATALQAFRDLFTEDVLRPGDDVEIDHITIMFTDLKGSTALYERIGDPQAYHLVREHFVLLGRAVRECDGAVVKTIGDAIMAVFINPGDALDCATRIHDEFDAFNRSSGKEPLIIKLGIHVGRCISVTLNDRLDYYGTAANKAARLQGQSTGGDIVLSPELAADPTIAQRLQTLPSQQEFAELKGYAEPIPFLRITAETLRTLREEALG